ncbi:MAG: ATP-binding protein [Gammaproteobacteria bacterium]|nr:ATP-binding protein [Gammaproteobacteria bacterium]MDH5800380.1 ATP-binding protein [Gammaproteobacteria bacterium]
MSDPNAPTDWAVYKAAVWRKHSQSLRFVKNTDTISLDDLVGIDTQTSQLLRNTHSFVNNHPANHALLWGAKGTGKSSLIKAIFNELSSKGLRLIEMDKDDLAFFPDVVDTIREQPFKFIIFCDDLSFDPQETQYKHLKSVLEGSIEVPPDNVLIYASSNRRLLMPQFMQDNLESFSDQGEIHFSDTIEEKTSLADRFGLWLSFYAPDTQSYLRLVDHYLPHETDRHTLHILANRFAIARGSKSGRTAKQFAIHYSQNQFLQSQQEHQQRTQKNHGKINTDV